MDDQPTMNQAEVVQHFRSLKKGTLTFTQSTLSRKVKKRAELEARVGSNPNALSSKRARVVTRPDVKRALVKWVRHMEEVKGETVSGPMLHEKRARFEEKLGVPAEERLKGIGWVPNFCRAYVRAFLEYLLDFIYGQVQHSGDPAPRGGWICQCGRRGKRARSDPGNFEEVRTTRQIQC